LAPVGAIEGRDGAIEIAVAHQLHKYIGVVAIVGHGDVEMLHPARDVGDDLGDLSFAVGAALGEDAYRKLVFADAVDAAGEVIFGAEGGLEKTVDDLAIGEALLLGALARGHGRRFAGAGIRRLRHEGGHQATL
jgi:hypothetical protein